MRYETVAVTPEMAHEFLGNNPSNRSINRNRVSTMANDMKNGRWVVSPQPLIFTKEGELMDGQHRLRAVIAADVTVDFSICYDADKSAMPIIDHIAPRTTADLLTIEGYLSAAIVAAISRKIVAYQNGSKSIVSSDQRGGTSAGQGTSASKQEVAIFARSNYPALLDVARKASIICDKSKITLLSGSEVGFCLWVLKPEHKAEEFLMKTIGGIGLVEGSPEHRLRGLIERARIAKKSVMTSTELTAKIFQAFNASLKQS